MLFCTTSQYTVIYLLVNLAVLLNPVGEGFYYIHILCSILYNVRHAIIPYKNLSEFGNGCTDDYVIQDVLGLKSLDIELLRHLHHQYCFGVTHSSA